MRHELRRNVRGLRLPGHPPPYFISYLLRDVRSFTFDGRYGALYTDREYHSVDLYSEVRVGSHRQDQTMDGGLDRRLGERGSAHWIHGPLDLDADALRYSLWKLTHFKYSEALQDYYDKQKTQVQQRLPKDASCFTKEPRHVRLERIESKPPALARWRRLAREASARFSQHRRLIDPYVRVWGADLVRVFVSSEGSRFISQDRYHRVAIEAWLLDDGGAYLHASRYFSALDEEQLPSLSEVKSAIDQVAEELDELKASPPLDPYAGPALLSGRATGLLFHEAVGHRLEGERMLSRSEGRTFAEAIGRQILPKEVDLIDDPTLDHWGDEPLLGHYRIDDEGVSARPVKLVEKGVLKTFLLSRTPAPGFKHSNGHARQEEVQAPMARMSNLVVKSDAQHGWAELKATLCELVKARGLPYGIIIKDASSGETQTDSYDFQAFKGLPTHVAIVDPDTGQEKRVRGVSFIGTPLAAIQRIRAFGRDYQVDNSFCYAESGAVPVSTVAPAMLLEELELQRENQRNYRAPVLPLPAFRRR